MNKIENSIKENLKQKFPEHGWAYNIQNVRLLYFPIFSALQNIQTLRKQNKATIDFISNQKYQEQLNSCYSTFRKLAIVLREISRNNKIIQKIPFSLDFNNLTEEQSTELWLSWELVPLYIDLAIIYFKRLGDQLAKILRYIFIDNYTEFEIDTYGQLENSLLKDKSPQNIRLLCDFSELKQIFKTYSQWYNVLSAKDHKGLRSLLEHQDGILNTAISKEGNKPPSYFIQILNINSNDSYNKASSNLMEKLEFICKDFCDFSTQICQLIKYQDEYKPILFLGEDSDIANFWPEIKID